mmetsp:Transcript_38657/g.53869  ORF Transcript_38657/g.53869 Transcript_38657/m.53869 type:complete len:303 (-) Transcript_38657:1169-2077(-)
MLPSEIWTPPHFLLSKPFRLTISIISPAMFVITHTNTLSRSGPKFKVNPSDLSNSRFEHCYFIVPTPRSEKHTIQSNSWKNTSAVEALRIYLFSKLIIRADCPTLNFDLLFRRVGNKSRISRPCFCCIHFGCTTSDPSVDRPIPLREGISGLPLTRIHSEDRTTLERNHWNEGIRCRSTFFGETESRIPVSIKGEHNEFFVNIQSTTDDISSLPRWKIGHTCISITIQMFHVVSQTTVVRQTIGMGIFTNTLSSIENIYPTNRTPASLNNLNFKVMLVTGQKDPLEGNRWVVSRSCRDDPIT